MEENNYFRGYTESDNRLDYLKYGLFNEFGLNLDRCKNGYKEDNIIRKKCNIKNIESVKNFV